MKIIITAAILTLAALHPALADEPPKHPDWAEARIHAWMSAYLDQPSNSCSRSVTTEASADTEK